MCKAVYPYISIHPCSVSLMYANIYIETSIHSHIHTEFLLRAEDQWTSGSLHCGRKLAKTWKEHANSDEKSCCYHEAKLPTNVPPHQAFNSATRRFASSEKEQNPEKNKTESECVLIMRLIYFGLLSYFRLIVPTCATLPSSKHSCLRLLPGNKIGVHLDLIHIK